MILLLEDMQMYYPIGRLYLAILLEPKVFENEDKALFLIVMPGEMDPKLLNYYPKIGIGNIMGK